MSDNNKKSNEEPSILEGSPALEYGDIEGKSRQPLTAQLRPAEIDAPASGRLGRLLSCWPWAYALVSGGLLALCYPGFEMGAFCWVALIPLVCAVWFSAPVSRREPLRVAGLGFVFGLAFFSVSSFWLTSLTGPGYALLVIYFALYPAVWTLFLRALANRGDDTRWLSSLHNLRVCAMGAAGWVALEWLRGVIFPAFGWNGLGIALYKNTPMIQIADITGVGGISFLVAMINLMAVATVKRLALEVGRGARRPHYDFGLTVALVAVVWGYGIRQIILLPKKGPDANSLSFAAVQANIPQATRNDPKFESTVLELYEKHTSTAAAMRPDLILWSESATPSPLFNDQRTWDIVSKLAEAFDGDLLTGTVFLSDHGDYNTIALLTDHAQKAQMYHKMHLVPFGEYVPLRQAFPFFAWVVGDLVPGDFDAGREPVVLELSARPEHRIVESVKGDNSTGSAEAPSPLPITGAQVGGSAASFPPVKLGPLICFEDTVGELARQFTLRGAQAFVVVTNDGWFLKSAGSQQHLANAIFRCAENKLPMIRAANTGVTCSVNRFGAVKQILQNESGDTHIEGVLFGDLAVTKPAAPTFYTRFGEVFSLLCLAISAATGAVFLLQIVKNKNSSCPESSEKKISML